MAQIAYAFANTHTRTHPHDRNGAHLLTRTTHTYMDPTQPHTHDAHTHAHSHKRTHTHRTSLSPRLGRKLSLASCDLIVRVIINSRRKRLSPAASSHMAAPRHSQLPHGALTARRRALRSAPPSEQPAGAGWLGHNRAGSPTHKAYVSINQPHPPIAHLSAKQQKQQPAATRTTSKQQAQRQRRPLSVTQACAHSV